MKIDITLIVVIIILILLLLFGVWILSDPTIQQADLDAAYHDGIVEGCVEMFISIAGPPPSDGHRLALVEACIEIANGIIGTNAMPDPIVPQDALLPTAQPGSWT